MVDFKKVFVGTLAAGSFALITATAGHAANLIQTWTLFDHPDGNQAPPAYGLRLDGLFNTGSGTEWTFSFEAPGAGVTMQLFDDNSLNISGTIFGGVDNGSGYQVGNVGLWDLDFTYQNVVFSNTANNVPVTVNTSPGASGQSGVGTIRALFDVAATTEVESIATTNLVIDLIEKANNSGLAFKYADDGHRCGGHDAEICDDRSVGRGWLNHSVTYGGSTSNHINASDFLFTGDVSAVPLPAAAPLFLGALGVIGLVGARRRRIAA